MKILIAEDDPVSRQILQTVLERLGHEVLVNEDGLQAWEAFKENPCEVIVSDWMMPNMDGLELCRRVRQDDADYYVYFILLTALVGRDNHIKANKAGVDDFMTKPLDREMVWMRLQVAERIINYHKTIKKLQDKILTICAWSKQVKVNETEWQDLDTFLREALGAKISHGIAPDVFKRIMEEEGLS